MAVAARTVNSLTEAANARHESLAQALVRAGTYSLELGDEVMTGWHSHEFHQLEYAVEGVAEVETATARYLLPPRQALWIPAGVEHSSTLTHVKAVSVFFHPAMDLPAGDRVRILAVAPLLREMILYAAAVAVEPHGTRSRWPTCSSRRSRCWSPNGSTTRRRCASPPHAIRSSRPRSSTPTSISPTSRCARCATRSARRSDRCGARSSTPPGCRGVSTCRRAGC